MVVQFVCKMDILINKPKMLKGEITPPPSKSVTHRVLAAASLTGRTLIKNPSHSEANDAMKNACTQLGAEITTTPEGDYDVKGFGCRTPSDKIWIGNSGTALRLSIALATLVSGKRTIDGDASLRRRPTKPLVDALNNLGSTVTGTPIHGTESYAPVTVTGGTLSGGKINIVGTKSSQYLSSLLLVSPFSRSDIDIEVTGDVVSKPYIDMTIQVLEQFGIKVDASDDRHYHISSGQQYKSPGVCEIPTDYSQAAFFLSAACLVDSDITVKCLSPNDNQADEQIVDILTDMGANIERHGNDLRVRGPFDLEGIEVDLMKAPDLFPVLSIMGIYAKGSMRLHNMPQIRYKETDRISVIAREFKKYGIKVDDNAQDEMTVYHKDMPEQNYDFTAKGDHGITDHRVAMALSLIGIRSGCSIIREADRVSISYPDYFSHLDQVGVKTEVLGKPENEIPQNLAM